MTVKKGTVIFLLYLPFVRYLFDIPDDILNTGRNMKHTWVNASFHSEVDENCALLSYYAASSGNLLPTFRDNLSDLTLEDGTEKLSRNVSKKLPLLSA